MSLESFWLRWEATPDVLRLRTPARREGRLARQGHPRSILFTVLLLVFSSASQIIIPGPILPRIGEELGVGTSLLGVPMTA